MFRKLITMLLLVATVAGPQWCCCKMRQWLAEPALAASQPAGVLPACCTRSHAQGSEKQLPGKPSCPCKQRTRDITQSAPTSDVVQDLRRSAERIGESLFLDALLSAALSEPCLPSKFTDGYPPAPLGGRDLLRAYQIMRC